MKKREKEALSMLKEFDANYRAVAQEMFENQARARRVAESSPMVQKAMDYAFAKMLCNSLVYHLTELYEGDMEKVRDFIVRGTNIDLRIAQRVSEKWKS